MIVVKLNEPVSNIIINIAELKINSYEIIAAVDRRDPKKAYLASFLSIFSFLNYKYNYNYNYNYNYKYKYKYLFFIILNINITITIILL
jgi:hypothetical protein